MNRTCLAERGHSCPQQRDIFQRGGESRPSSSSQAAADKNVRAPLNTYGAPPAVTDGCHKIQTLLLTLLLERDISYYLDTSTSHCDCRCVELNDISKSN